MGSNHAVSGLKFKILQRFLKLGYAVLLSDVDIIVLRDPFDHLFKDSDVESMSDGWNNQTAYGDPFLPSPTPSNPHQHHRLPLHPPRTWPPDLLPPDCCTPDFTKGLHLTCKHQ